MRLAQLTQPSFQTTLMGVIKGALDYFGFQYSNAAVFGGSGHAFLINIHEEICPSSRYRWKYDAFWPLVHNLGLEVESLGFFTNKSSPAERATVESRLVAALDEGLPCAVQNMENQLIAGYEANRFLLLRPWECAPEITPAALTFGTWAELGQEVHTSFFVFRRTRPASPEKTLHDALRWACDIFLKPANYNFEHYGVGPDAYDNWLRAVEKGLGGSHGNWWNAEVWSECRLMAANWFRELAQHERPSRAELCRLLVRDYTEIGELLRAVGEKTMPLPEKVSTLAELKARELRAVAHIETCLALMTQLGVGASRETDQD